MDQEPHQICLSLAPPRQAPSPGFLKPLTAEPRLPKLTWYEQMLETHAQVWPTPPSPWSTISGAPTFIPGVFWEKHPGGFTSKTHLPTAESLPIKNSIQQRLAPMSQGTKYLTTRSEKKKLAKPRRGGKIQRRSRRRGCPHNRKKASSQSSSSRSNLAEIQKLWLQVANPSLFIDGKTKAQGSSCSYRVTWGRWCTLCKAHYLYGLISSLQV